MSKLIRCRACNRPLSTALEREVSGSSTNHEDGQPFVPGGSFHVSDGEFFTGSEGRYIINLSDGLNLRDHPDRRRLNGCCGLDGVDGVNRICQCGAEVATEKSDCWMPHALLFERGVVDLVEDAG
jgi:hypothetical protein